jgi:hypothetical protein
MSHQFGQPSYLTRAVVIVGCSVLCWAFCIFCFRLIFAAFSQ